MQTTGATLLVVELRSVPYAWMAAQDSRSAHGLLYPLLYGPTGATKNIVKVALTVILLHSLLWRWQVSIYLTGLRPSPTSNVRT
jgi:hypothetical protein